MVNRQSRGERSAPMACASYFDRLPDEVLFLVARKIYTDPDTLPGKYDRLAALRHAANFGMVCKRFRHVLCTRVDLAVLDSDSADEFCAKRLSGGASNASGAEFLSCHLKNVKEKLLCTHLAVCPGAETLKYIDVQFEGEPETDVDDTSYGWKLLFSILDVCRNLERLSINLEVVKAEEGSYVDQEGRIWHQYGLEKQLLGPNPFSNLKKLELMGCALRSGAENVLQLPTLELLSLERVRLHNRAVISNANLRELKLDVVIGGHCIELHTPQLQKISVAFGELELQLANCGNLESLDLPSGLETHLLVNGEGPPTILKSFRLSAGEDVAVDEYGRTIKLFPVVTELRWLGAGNVSIDDLAGMMCNVRRLWLNQIEWQDMKSPSSRLHTFASLEVLIVEMHCRSGYYDALWVKAFVERAPKLKAVHFVLRRWGILDVDYVYRDWWQAQFGNIEFLYL